MRLSSRVSRLVRKLRGVPRRLSVAALRNPVTRPAARWILNPRFDPFDPDFLDDPYPVYRRLRESDPVHWSHFGVWLVTRYADAASMLRDARFGHPDHKAIAFASGDSSVAALLRANMLMFKNPPDHTRLRRLVEQVFTPRLVAGLRPFVQRLADRLLDDVEGARQMDIVHGFAVPLPVGVIAEVFGLPAADAQACHEWTRHMIGPLALGGTPEAGASRRMAGERMVAYFSGILDQRRRAPGRDLIRSLIQLQVAGAEVEDDELLATCVLLFGAGHETTVRLIGNGILTLLRHPDELRRLRERPSLLTQAIDELLRYESPVQMIGRTAQEDVTLSGRCIRAGQAVYAVVGAANRDPAQFADPDRFDLGRVNNRHLSFGSGIHACLGQGLARLEAEVAIGALIRRMPGLELATVQPEWRREPGIRALMSLPVAW